MTIQQFCLDCNGGVVIFPSDDIQFIMSTKMEVACNKCGAKWSLRELLQDRDENCKDCGWPPHKHPNPWCKAFIAKNLV